MKKLILPLMATFCFGVQAQVAANLQSQGELIPLDSFDTSVGGQETMTVLPMSINITQFINDNGIDLESLTATEAKLALFGYSKNDLSDSMQLQSIDKNKLIMTAEGHLISFEKKVVFFKEGAGSYTMVSMVDANIGAAVKLGDEFYIQLQAHANVPGLGLGRDQSGVFSISDREFEAFKQSVGCANCEQIDNSEMITKYGADLKVQYKRFGLSLYNNNYFSNATSNLSVAPLNQNVERNDNQRLVKNSTVREFGVELSAKLADLGPKTYITAIVGYSVSAHMSKSYKERDVYGHDERVQTSLIEYTSREEYTSEAPSSFSGVGLFRAGIRLNF